MTSSGGSKPFEESQSQPSSQLLFGFLKKTVDRIVEVEKDDESNNDTLQEVNNVHFSSQIEKEKASRKRRPSRHSSSHTPKKCPRVERKEPKYNCTSSSIPHCGTCDCRLLNRFNLQIIPREKNDDNDLMLKANFDQLLWTLQYLEYNPQIMKENAVKMVYQLCEGLDNVTDLSSLSLPDKEHRRFLRILSTLFSFVQTYDQDNSPMWAILKIYDRLESVFDNFLDCLSRDELTTEEQLIRFGSIKGILIHFKGIKVRRIFVEKLVLRIRLTAFRIYRAFIFQFSASDKPRSKRKSIRRGMDLDPQQINLFYYYCQILEASITTVTEDSQGWIEESVYKALLYLNEGSTALFQIYPNLKCVFYPILIAASRHLTKEKQP